MTPEDEQRTSEDEQMRPEDEQMRPEDEQHMPEVAVDPAAAAWGADTGPPAVLVVMFMRRR
jgi:hypothetical protein